MNLKILVILLYRLKIDHTQQTPHEDEISEPCIQDAEAADTEYVAFWVNREDHPSIRSKNFYCWEVWYV